MVLQKNRDTHCIHCNFLQHEGEHIPSRARFSLLFSLALGRDFKSREFPKIDHSALGTRRSSREDDSLYFLFPPFFLLSFHIVEYSECPIKSTFFLLRFYCEAILPDTKAWFLSQSRYRCQSGCVAPQFFSLKKGSRTPLIPRDFAST